MADLKKWFPFKFRRKDDKAEKSEASAPAPAAMAPVTPSLLMPGFSSMHQLMDRMFSDPFFRRPFSMLGEMDRFFGDYAPASFSPNVDLVDEGGHVKVTAELPGLDKDDIELSVNEGSLMLRGEKKHESRTDEEGCYRTERYFGAFQRAIPLPVDLDIDKAVASFDKGVLTVRLPKSERTPDQRTIPVG